MQFYSRRDKVDVDLYEERLNRMGSIFLDLVGVGTYAQQQACKAATLHRLCLRYMNLHAKDGFSALSSDSVKHYLQVTEGIPRQNFKKKGVIGESLSTDKVLIPLLKNGYAPDFLKLYIAHQSCKSRSNNMTAFYKRHSATEKIRGWEEYLTPIPFTANRNVNLRFNYSNENLISLPKDMRGVIKAREDYVLVWGDFAQSDARIAYNLLLKDEVNIKYILAFPDDIYAGFANWVQEYQRVELEKLLANAKAFREGVMQENGQDVGTVNIEMYEKLLSEWKPFTGFKSKEERDLYKVYVLETIYGTRFHKVAEAGKFIQTLGRVLDACPKYKKFWDDIKKRAAFGFPLRVQCYMGHVEHVMAFSGARINDTLFKCLNYPVQGCTSEFMIVTVNRILDKFYSLGYTEDDVHVYYCRHDEPVFEIKKSVMKDSWIFGDYSRIQVDDWTPLGLDFSFGRVYGEVEQNLMDDFHLSTKINAGNLGFFEPKLQDQEYYPLENLLEISVKVEKTSETEALVAVYCAHNNSSVIRYLKPPPGVDDITILRLFVEKYLNSIFDAGYYQLVIYNDSNYYEDDLAGDLPIVRLYRPSSNSSMHKATIIATAAACAKNKTESNVVEQNREFLGSLNYCTLFGG